MTTEKKHATYEILGGRPLKGELRCFGAKNFATKAMVASLLSNEVTTLFNVPRIGDVEITKDLIGATGAKVSWIGEHVMQIDPSTVSNSHIVTPDSKTNRLPILLLSVLAQRFGRASVPVVGGDDIGFRKVDFHIQALQKFGAKVEYVDQGYTAETHSRLKGCHFYLPYPSVMATESCLFLSALAEGTSVIRNIAIEPEIMELISMLRSMGAIIFLSSGREVTVHGVEKLSGTEMHILGDRIEAASWATLACAADGDIEVSGIRPETLGNFLSHYRQIGGGFEFKGNDKIRFYRARTLTPTVIETDVFPGFSTDWQQPFAVLLTQAQGVSVIHETVHEQRFGYLPILNRLGAQTQLTNRCLGAEPCRYKGFDFFHSALIIGPTPLTASKETLTVPDIRAGLAYVVAGAIAKGTTRLNGIEEIERGYGDLPKRLAAVGLEIQRKN